MLTSRTPHPPCDPNCAAHGRALRTDEPPYGWSWHKYRASLCARCNDALTRAVCLAASLNADLPERLRDCYAELGRTVAEERAIDEAIDAAREEAAQ